MDIIKSIEHEQLKNKIPELKVGNTVKVHVRIKEGNKERIQIFEGIIIKVQGGGVNQSFTVRKISYGVGVEKTFLVHSPLVERVELVRVGKARRARLFYLRDRIGKAAKTKEQIGARIEDKEIVVKEELVEEPVEEVVEEVVETTETVEPAVEEVKEEPVIVEEGKQIEIMDDSEEKPAEEVKAEEPVIVEEGKQVEIMDDSEEKPAVETTEIVTEEVIDTVKEEPVEEVKEEPVIVEEGKQIEIMDDSEEDKK